MNEIVRTAQFGDWLCAAALVETKLGRAGMVADASVALLPLAPPSQALLALADPPNNTTYLADVLEEIGAFLRDLAIPSPSPLDFAWIVLWTTFRVSKSEPEILAQNQLRFELHLRFSELHEFTAPFVADQDDLDEGVDARSIAKSVTDDVAIMRPRFLASFSAHFAASDASWVSYALS